MRPEAGKVVAGRYRLERPLASGGMGAVWVARHLQLDVPVAVKFMFDEMRATASGSARFLREAKAVARLRSPHVVRAYDYDIVEGTPYIAMELLEGESLDQRIRRERRLSLAETSRVLREVAKGLREAHDLGIVHRDLKPANIFLATVGQDEIVKLLDFGIAKDTKERLVDDNTATGAVLGSPHHMSPEQARGADVDARSDLWSLGVVLFQCLTAEKPFPGTNMGDVIARICADPIPNPTSFVPELGPDVDRFFERALARNPAMRFQSAREMADAFDAVVHTGAEPDPYRPRSTAPAEARALAATPRSDVTRPVFEQAGTTDAESTVRDVNVPAPKRSLSRFAAPALAIVVAGIAWYAIAYRQDAPASPQAAPAEVATDARGQVSADPQVRADVPIVSPDEGAEPTHEPAPPSAAPDLPPVSRGASRARPPARPSAVAPQGSVPSPRGSSRPDDKFF